MESIRARLMQDTALYLPVALQPPPYRTDFGPVKNVPVGTTWKTRKECAAAGVHIEQVAGISGTKQYGAYSVVLNGAYEDDVDNGDTFIYSGAGGRPDSASWGGAASQIVDQSFEHKDNMALQRSKEHKREVRVIRGPNLKSKYAPREGYRYDGLYIVETTYASKGQSGHIVCKFRFRRVEGQPPLLPTF